MKLSLTLFLVLMALSAILCQRNTTVSGYVVDSITGETLIGSTVLLLKSEIYTTTNNYGFFSLEVRHPKEAILQVSYLGYDVKKVVLEESLKKPLVIQVSPSTNTLGEIEIVANKNRFFSPEALDLKTLKALPIVGEEDLLRSLQLLPGVQTGGEGQVSFHVRGGNNDQNLIMIDETPVYSPSHALGFLSTFNNDAIKSASLYKDGFSAEYGGRTSSVLDIRMKEGNSKKFKAKGSIGLLSSKIMFEGPIKKEKTSFLLSARRSYLDVVAKPFIPLFLDENDLIFKPKVYFYDINSKIKHKINDRTSLFLSGYFTRDIFNVELGRESNKFGGGTDWSNIVGSIRLANQLSDKLFLNTTLHFSDFNNRISSFSNISTQEESSSSSYRYTNGIADISFKSVLQYSPNKSNFFKVGVEQVRHNYKTGSVEISSQLKSGELDTVLGNPDILANEFNLFINDDIKIGRLLTSIGLRYSRYSVESKNYNSLQPRVKVAFKLNQYTFKVTFDEMTQFINQVTSSSLILPTDIWVPSTTKFNPQESRQYTIGVNRSFGSNYNLSLQGYFKKLGGVLAYKEGSSFFNPLDIELQSDFDWKSNITQGTGETYGTEILFEKSKGKLTGFLSYTLSWSNRQFELLNNSESFPYRYGRRHDLSISYTYEINDQIKFSSNWIWGTGNALSLPQFSYPIDYQFRYQGNELLFAQYESINALGPKNSFRMSNYHRLDLGLIFRKEKKRYTREIVIGAYNTYFHSNPYALRTSYSTTKQKVVFEEVSLLPFIVPSITYNFEF